ncbi:carboxypeptidase-like regulatory domain-containing protein [Zobellia russellii]|uniref:carboxypeptidase-like regulatory domain-containing protein n=1 Tax=Zobellia russellii TaxID=248907 RepID=UPI001BFF1243|nr:carboxypeptidase-like regulatory domain-containing protein [Zobellia russellii]MBT9190157.1 carboxypeptidase-like regulatory domain-containing protein [Zobellia russellii]
MKHQLQSFKFIRSALSLLFLVSAFSFTAQAQDGFVVQGKVVDDAGIPLPGTSILEKGTTNGVSADFDGEYSIVVSDRDAVLVASYIGFAEQEI